jgi:hypothetical protein
VERWRTKNEEECAVFTTTAEGVIEEKRASVVDMMDSKISDNAMTRMAAGSSRAR